MVREIACISHEYSGHRRRKRGQFFVVVFLVFFWPIFRYQNLFHDSCPSLEIWVGVISQIVRKWRITGTWNKCPWCHRGTSCYFWSFIILFFQRNCTTSVFSDWLKTFCRYWFLTLLLKRGDDMTILTPVTFICAFPMQRGFVKVIIFLYGFCLERSLLASHFLVCC